MDKFALLHDYNTLVRRGMASPLTCNKDGFIYTVRFNDGEIPLLKCYECGGSYFPSDREYAEWQKIVEEKL